MMLVSGGYQAGSTALSEVDGDEIVGEEVPGGSAFLASAELYEPTSRTWSATTPMLEPRSRHSATLLLDGRVLVTGGRAANEAALATAEVYENGQWAPTASMGVDRHLHTATLLADGRVLVAGGILGGSPTGPATDVVEVFDPSGNAGSGAWTPVGNMHRRRKYHDAVRLSDGRVLVTGGLESTAFAGEALSHSETFDPLAGSWSEVAHMHVPRYGHRATAVPGDRIIVTGGTNGKAASSSVEAYTPGSSPAGEWSLMPMMLDARQRHVALVLGDRLLVAGGFNQGVRLSSAEALLHDDQEGSWLGAGEMTTPRSAFEGVELADGVLLIGGYDGKTSLATAETFRVVPAGEPCVGSGQCTTALCAAGFCCNERCKGPCRACTAADKGGGEDGICEPVTYNPCKEYVCDPSGPCLVSCAIDSDCASGYGCTDGGQCVYNGIGTCDAGVLTRPDGTQELCARYACVPNRGCLETCETNRDCAAGNVCKAGIVNECVPLRAGVSEVPGCSCSLPAPCSASARWLIMLGVSYIALSMRRQRRAETGNELS
ncbi:Kelch repeat-containing protein [Polyangium spumosum]|nr:kelch repeat-containing protein [Polyangium spumosum]